MHSGAGSLAAVDDGSEMPAQPGTFMTPYNESAPAEFRQGSDSPMGW